MKTMIIDSFKGKYAFLSNFYPVRISFDGHDYRTVEHAYQAFKTVDDSWRRKIREAETASAAKHLGRRAPVRSDWEGMKFSLMLLLLRMKFNIRHPDMLCLQLAGTKDAELVEGNTWGDIYWGVCRGEGQNRLGQLLMHVRSEVVWNMRTAKVSEL